MKINLLDSKQPISSVGRILPARFAVFLCLPLFYFVACTGGANLPNPPVAEGTGIPVASEFEDFYREFGGPRVFGYPLTEAFIAREEGPLIQYFQTMRLEYDPSHPPGEGIGIYPLGEWAFAGLTELEPVPVGQTSQSRYFPETELTVQDEFLTFYNAYNGEHLFGPPISPQLNEGGLRVQYFRNARLEWHPELPVEQRIQVGLLGKAHFDAEMVFQYRQFSLARPVSSADITDVSVSASVRAPILYRGEQQVLYVTVLTPDGRPVSDISLDVRLAYNGTSKVVVLGQTDEEGRIQATLDLTDVPPGKQVQMFISVYAENGEVIGTSTLGFRTWW